MKALTALATLLLLTACTTGEIARVGNEIGTIERHAVKAEVGILKEQTLNGVRVITEIQRDATHALTQIKREADKALPPTPTATPPETTTP